MALSISECASPCVEVSSDQPALELVGQRFEAYRIKSDEFGCAIQYLSVTHESAATRAC